MVEPNASLLRIIYEDRFKKKRSKKFNDNLISNKTCKLFWKKLMGLYFFPLDFPREPEKDDCKDEEDGGVENIEELFGKSTESLGRLRARIRLWDPHSCKAVNQKAAKTSHECARATQNSGYISFLESGN